MKSCLFIGGIKSGKSDLALNYAKEIKNSVQTKKLIFIATACYYHKNHNGNSMVNEFDLEMKQKIADHKSQRGCDWQTIEECLELDKIMRDERLSNNIVVVDCISMWLTTNFIHQYSKFKLNIFDDRQTRKQQEKIVTNIKSKILKLTHAFSKSKAADLIIVSNEVGLSLIEPNKNLRTYTELLASFNQKLAKSSQDVFLVVAGNKLRIKP